MRGAVVGSRSPLGASAGPATGDGAVVVTTDLQALQSDLRARVTRPMWRHLDDGVGDVLASARADWPVRSGLSRSRLVMRSRIDDGEPFWRVTGEAPYTRVIVERGKAPQHTASRLIFDPLGEAITTAIRKAADEIERGQR